MTYEYEFRKIAYFPTLAEALTHLPSIPNNHFLIYYIQSYRIKPHLVEYKKILSQETYFFDGVWFRYVKSLEVPFHRWKQQQYREFHYLLGLDREHFITEERYEVELTPQAKIYVFTKNHDTFGVCFELESRKVQDLYQYKTYYSFEGTTIIPPTTSTLKISRKPVLSTLRQPDGYRHLVAIKHDGIFGFVHCFHDHILEKWEDNRHVVNSTKGFYPGYIFTAERLFDGTVVLLDVIAIHGIWVYRKDIRHVLVHFLPTITNLPSTYKLQKYYRSTDTVLSSVASPTDGLIFHTFNDQIFKLKSVNTVELLYENGALKSFERSFPYSSSSSLDLIPGRIYECEMNPLRVIKERPDRCLPNTEKQIKSIFGNLDNDV